MDTSKTGTQTLAATLWGFIVGGDTQRPMRYSTLDRLIFVGSFVWVAHWATKVTEVIFKALF